GADLAAAGLDGGTVTVDDRPATLGRTYADAPAGGLVVLVDSAGQLAVAVNGGDAAATLGAMAGDRITVRS
ncbi:MAG TPA: SAM hydroxide adenosyltransferase, partial [Mycobacteriales bacterium]|nr:SAM hydroxide adenosyltransferase [Mycobacteriales bacterium]